MKLYNKAEFLKLPPNTLFMFGPGRDDDLAVGSSSLNVKYGSMKNDFVYKSLVDLEANGSDEICYIQEAMVKDVVINGVSENYPMDLEATTGEGFYEESSLYLVFDKEEIKAIVSSLQSLL